MKMLLSTGEVVTLPDEAKPGMLIDHAGFAPAHGETRLLGHAAAYTSHSSRWLTAGLFDAALCSLGCLGIITEITLKVSPAFDIQVHERHTSMMDALKNWKARAQRHEWYRFWWFPHTGTCFV